MVLGIDCYSPRSESAEGQYVLQKFTNVLYKSMQQIVNAADAVNINKSVQDQDS
jgi:hypothetical protein